jgi:hypothetical protein
MTIATPLSLRWERAQRIDRLAIEPPASVACCTGCLQPECPRGILFMRIVYVLSLVFMEPQCPKNGTMSRKYCASICS